MDEKPTAFIGKIKRAEYYVNMPEVEIQISTTEN